MRFNRILTGDALQQLKKLPADTAQGIIADRPPFNVLTKQDWDTRWKAAGK